MAKPPQPMLDKLFFNWCYLQAITYIIILNSVLSCVTVNPSQHTYFCNTQLLNMSNLCRPTFCSIQHSRFNRRSIKLAFQLLWYHLVTENARRLSSLDPPCFDSMANVRINIYISLQHRSQIPKGILLRHYLTFQTHISLLLYNSAKVPSKLTSPFSCITPPKSHLMYLVLVLLNLKPLDSRICHHNSSFLFTPAWLSSTNTTSSTNNIHQGISLYRKMYYLTKYYNIYAMMY